MKKREYSPKLYDDSLYLCKLKKAIQNLKKIESKLLTCDISEAKTHLLEYHIANIKIQQQIDRLKSTCDNFDIQIYISKNN